MSADRSDHVSNTPYDLTASVGEIVTGRVVCHPPTHRGPRLSDEEWGDLPISVSTSRHPASRLATFEEYR